MQQKPNDKIPDTKICNICKIDKPWYEFSLKIDKRKGRKLLYWACIPCKRSFHREYYKNRLKTRQLTLAANIRLREKIANYVWNYLTLHPCVDCGEKDQVVLQFDHLSNKTDNVATLRRRSLRLVKVEIEKCVVRCANCHIKKTAKEFGWYTNITNWDIV